jgi:hypothetical protein
MALSKNPGEGQPARWPIDASEIPDDLPKWFRHLKAEGLIVPSDAEPGKFDYSPDMKRQLMRDVGVYEAIVNEHLARLGVISKSTLAWWEVSESTFDGSIPDGRWFHGQCEKQEADERDLRRRAHEAARDMQSAK